jgi:hypothetical protein
MIIKQRSIFLIWNDRDICTFFKIMKSNNNPFTIISEERLIILNWVIWFFVITKRQLIYDLSNNIKTRMNKIFINLMLSVGLAKQFIPLLTMGRFFFIESYDIFFIWSITISRNNIWIVYMKWLITCLIFKTRIIADLWIF